MTEEMIKKDTHIVIKKKWVEENLNETETMILSVLLAKATKNKPAYGYYVVNTDEPYADKVKELIMREEKTSKEILE